MKIELSEHKKSIIKQANEELRTAEIRHAAVLEAVVAVAVLEDGAGTRGWMLDSDFNLVKPDENPPVSGIIEEPK